MAAAITETELQIWFEEKSRQRVIGNYIVNCDELKTVPKSNRRGLNASERAQMEALDKARKIVEMLEYAEHLSGNRNIASKGHTQLRPDLIMISPDGHYLLVELKTLKGTERQAVQELLAYSAAMKMQLPFVNEFMFIIVANHWDTLLSFSVRSLIMDGKHVLPLSLEITPNGELSLHIEHKLFEMSFSEPYDPFYAMIPATLATTVYENHSYGFDSRISWTRKHSKRQVINYFHNIASQIAHECRHAKQGGFVMVWSNKESNVSECISLTVVTVNQYWKYNESIGSEVELDRGNIPEAGVKRVNHNVAKALRQEIHAQYLRTGDISDELDALFRSAEVWQAEANLHAQSTLSWDLIDRHSMPEQEKLIVESGCIQGFDHGGENNLKQLLCQMQGYRSGSVEILYGYGDMADFLREKYNTDTCIMNLRDFVYTMNEFRAIKILDK